MQSLNDLLSLRQHLRNAVASLRTMVLDAPSDLPESQQCLFKSLRESAHAAGRIDHENKDDDLEAVWDQLKARLDRFREAADTSHDLLERWKANERPESFQAAAAFMANHLFSAHSAAMGLLNHMITVVAFDWPASLPSSRFLAAEALVQERSLCREAETFLRRTCSS